MQSSRHLRQAAALRRPFQIVRLTAALAAVVLLASAAPARAQSEEAATRARVWELGGRLSLAALGVANGSPQAAVQKVYDGAKELGASLGVTVPPLPERPLDRAGANTVALDYLLRDAGAPLAASIGSTYGADHAALFEVAVKSTLLLLLYTPGDPEGLEVAGLLRTRAPDAGLPERFWQPVVAKIEGRAPFDDVKAAVSALQGDVRRYLKGE